MTERSKVDRPKKATSFDVAKLAGVSRSTVSVVLNNVTSVSVSPETQARVLAAARKLQYQPNFAARAVSTRKAYTIGLISCWDPISPLFARPVQGMLQAVQTAGYALTMCDLGIHQSGGSARLAIDFFREGRIDGVIVLTKSVGMAAMHIPLIDELRREAIPFVLINSGITASNVHDVTTDNFHAGALATEHLISLGHRRIAFLMQRTGRRDGVPSAEDKRLKGYLHALSTAGIAPDDSLIIKTDYSPVSIETGHKAFANFLAQASSPPTAVYAINDYLAIGAISAAEKSGLRVPDDLSVVGTDDLDIARQMTPGLTTVRQPLREIGEAAATRLLNLIDAKNSAEPLQRQMPCHLIIRASTATAPTKER